MKQAPLVAPRALSGLLLGLALMATSACAPPGGRQVDGAGLALSGVPRLRLARAAPAAVTRSASDPAWSPGGDLVSAGASEVLAPGGDGPEVFVRRGDVFVRRGGRERRLTRGEDRFFGPLLSPEGRLVAVVGLRTGVHVLDADTGRPLAHAGPRTSHPSWTPEARWLVYERVEDDGHALTAGDLEALAPATGGRVPLTETEEAIETDPAVSPDGRRLAFLRDGAVWVADLEEAAP